VSNFARIAVLWLVLIPGRAFAAEHVGFQVEATVALQELNPKFCWFHPRAAAIPKLGKDGQPAVIMTIQKHLIADDHYSGLWMMRTDDLGKTWTGPKEIPELAWRKEPGNDKVDLSVADVTPQWHAKTGKLIALGIQVRYNEKGIALLDKPRSYDFAYTVYDPKTDKWTVWRNIENVPELEGKFHTLAPGCVQSVIKDDGTLLTPVYIKGPAGSDYQATVLHLGFDGDKLTYLAHGDELKIGGGRGYVEPSLAFYRNKYYLTLRNDAKGYVTVSDDGLKYGPTKAWTFDDGSDLGSYNTQAHWLVHSEGLFLSYTRRGANNDHIPRNRAPIFLARVDTEQLHVIRATEQVLLPERGAMLGNFGASNITADESWVTDSEFIVNGQKHERGANGTTWVAKVKWTKPNALVAAADGLPVKIVMLGDSITRAVRPGVGPTETYAWMIGAELRARGVNAETVNVGIGGEQVDGALARLERDVIPLKPQVVTIMYGTNDSYQYKDEKGPRVTKEQYRKNLGQLVAKLRGAGIVPILMTPPRWGKAGKNGIGADPNPQLAEHLTQCREVAAAENVPLADHFQIWTDAEKNGTDIGGWTTDQCHPNPEGQHKLADALLPVLLKAIRDSAK
jgi:lysophospholipase L1-like esterase